MHPAKHLTHNNRHDRRSLWALTKPNVGVCGTCPPINRRCNPLAHASIACNMTGDLIGDLSAGWDVEYSQSDWKGRSLCRTEEDD